MNDNSGQTLREAIERLGVQNQRVFSRRDVSPVAQEFFRCHDTAHVVFGCDTSIFGEGVLKIFTIFGTTLGFWKHLSAYSDADGFALFRQYSWRHILQNVHKLIVNVPRTVMRARRMTKPWPWADHDEYLDKSVEEVRAEFNIEVVQRA